MNDEDLGRDRRRWSRTAAKKAKPGQWIDGRGWHQEKWTAPPEPERRRVSRPHASLNKVSPNNPVVLTHASGHATFANAKAMELSGITRQHDESRRRRDSQGRERQSDRPAARDRVAPDPPRHRRAARRPTKSARARNRVLELASEEALSKGITSFQDAGSSLRDVDLMKAMIDEGKIGVRLWMMLRAGNAALAAEPREVPDDRLRQAASSPCARSSTRSTARSARAARGCSSRTPTSPDSTGRNTTPVDDITRDRASSPCSTATSSASTRSATAPTARC